MVAWKRFPVPEFEYESLKDMSEAPATPISDGDAAALLAKHKSGDMSACGGYAVKPPAALLDKIKLKGDDVVAVMCLLPAKPVRVLGRSWAWKIQNAWILDSLDAGQTKVLHEWKTTRPMNTRLGPDDGVTLQTPVAYILSGNKYADHWRPNRSVIQNGWNAGTGRKGFRILGGSEPDLNDFHHACFMIDWPA